MSTLRIVEDLVLKHKAMGEELDLEKMKHAETNSMAAAYQCTLEEERKELGATQRELGDAKRDFFHVLSDLEFKTKELEIAQNQVKDLGNRLKASHSDMSMNTMASLLQNTIAENKRFKDENKQLKDENKQLKDKQATLASILDRN